MPTSDDVIACRDFCVAALRDASTQDWDVQIPGMDLTVGAVVAHVAQASLWYSIDLTAEGLDLVAANPQIKAEAGNDDLIAALHTCAGLFATVGARGFHPMGDADPSGFAAMACDEMLVHTHDACRGLSIHFEPPPEFARLVLERLFPWASSDGDPWSVLLWANGRIALDGHPQLENWRWHCAPLDEWDGANPNLT